MYEYSWTLDPNDPMRLLVKHNGQKIMSIFVGEIIESAGRHNVMDHVLVCDNTPWLTEWQKEREEIRTIERDSLIPMIRNSHKNV